MSRQSAESSPSEEERLLNAAAEIFLSPEHEVLNRVVLRDAAQRAGVPERSARRLFSSTEFRERLVPHLLQIRPGVDLGSEEILSTSQTLNDRSKDLTTAIEEAAAFFFEHAYSNSLLRAGMSLWPYAKGNPAIHRGLSALYEEWRSLTTAAINDVLVEHMAVTRLRSDWITVDELASVLTAVVEGLVIQKSLLDHERDELGGEPGSEIPTELMGKVFLALFASILEVDGYPSVRQLFDDIAVNR